MFITITVGDRLPQAIQKAKTLARANNTIVEFLFNRVLVTVNKNSCDDELLRFFMKI